MAYKGFETGLSRDKGWRERPQVGAPEQCPAQRLVTRVVRQILDAVASTQT
jgi:hypothetical protein